MNLTEYAKETGRTLQEVQRLWRKAEALILLEYDLVRPDVSEPKAVRAHYTNAVRQLFETMIDLPDEVTDDPVQLTETLLGDLAKVATTAVLTRRLSHLVCDAKTCRFNKRGKCRRSVTDIKINRNWECSNYKRG